jgi:hypothetical protein
MKPTRLVLFAMLAGVAAVTANCGDQTPMGVASTSAVSMPAPEAGLIGDLLRRVGLLKCTPLPSDSTSVTIGPLGGVVRIGPHSLFIPPGSLTSQVRITATQSRDTVNAVRFKPEGLTFRYPAALTMSYANCNLLGLLLPKRIAYTTDQYRILEYLLSLDNMGARQVTGKLKHFSQYAVAW